MIKKSKKCRWCKTPIKVSRKLYCNNSCKEKYRNEKIKNDPQLLAEKRKRDENYRKNLSEKKKKQRREYDKVYDKKRWKNTLSNPIKHKAKKVNDKEWQYIYYWKNKKKILDRRKFKRNQLNALGK